MDRKKNNPSPEFENVPSNEVNSVAPNVTIEIPSNENTPDVDDNQSPKEDEPKEKKKKKKKRSKNLERKPSTSRSRDNETENNKDTDTRARGRSKSKHNENSRPSSPRHNKNQEESVSGNNEKQPSTAVTVQVSPMSISIDIEEEKETGKNNNVITPAPIVVRQKSNTEVPNSKSQKTPVESSGRQASAQSITSNNKPQPYIPVAASSPRGTTGFPSLQVTGGLVVKEKESVLMNMDVAEVKELHERSQRQLAGIDNGDSKEAPVQKSGQTLKEAIAAAHKQAATFVNKIGDEANKTPTNTNASYRRTVGTNNEYAEARGASPLPQDNQRLAPSGRHQHPNKKRMKSRRNQSPQKGLPPPPMQPPPEYVDGYDSDESMYAPQFANSMNNRSNRIFSLDDSMIRDSQRDMNAAFDQLKNEKGIGSSKKNDYINKYKLAYLTKKDN